jgi:L-threonylcarbamoyladenylate synthase
LLDDCRDFHGLVSEIVSVLKAGGIVLMPSDTCYGFLADAHNMKAKEKLYALKDQPVNKPTSLCVADFDMLYEYGAFNQIATDIAVQFLPGKLTIIVPSLDPSFGDTVGLRLPDHSLMTGVAKKLSNPFFTTSANVHGKESPYDVSQIKEQFKDKFDSIDLVIDTGVLDFVLPSTVVKVVEDKIEIVREGDLAEELRLQFL